MKRLLFWLIIAIAGVVSIGISSKSAGAQLLSNDRGMIRSVHSLQAQQNPLPTISPAVVVETPNPRALPPVGRNAGLVVGASVLVLIIIAGVLGARRREKH
jgi:hypothetical protein